MTVKGFVRQLGIFTASVAAGFIMAQLAKADEPTEEVVVQHHRDPVSLFVIPGKYTHWTDAVDIRNQLPYAIGECEATIRADTTYRVALDVLRPGSNVVPMLNFIDSGRHRFDAVAYQAESVTVQCAAPHRWALRFALGSR